MPALRLLVNTFPIMTRACRPSRLHWERKLVNRKHSKLQHTTASQYNASLVIVRHIR